MNIYDVYEKMKEKYDVYGAFNKETSIKYVTLEAGRREFAKRDG